jgi:transposase
LRAFGHEPRIIPAIYVKPFVKGQKNDYNDAEAIAEAALQPNVRFWREFFEKYVPPVPPDNSTIAAAACLYRKSNPNIVMV